MSSIIRRRRGLIAAIGLSCLRGWACTTQILSDGRPSAPQPPAAAKRLSSINVARQNAQNTFATKSAHKRPTSRAHQCPLFGVVPKLNADIGIGALLTQTRTSAKISCCSSEAGFSPLSRRAHLGAYRCVKCGSSAHCTGQVPRRRGISTITNGYRRRANGTPPMSRALRRPRHDDLR